MTSDADERFRKQVKRELVNKYATPGTSNVTFVNFRRIHEELAQRMSERENDLPPTAA